MNIFLIMKCEKFSTIFLIRPSNKGHRSLIHVIPKKVGLKLGNNAVRFDKLITEFHSLARSSRGKES